MTVPTFFFIYERLSVLPNLQFGCREYQHLQCETHIFPCFSEKTAIFAVEKDLFAMKATIIERGFEIPILTASELQIRWKKPIQY